MIDWTSLFHNFLTKYNKSKHYNKTYIPVNNDDAPAIYQWSTSLLPIKVCLILEVSHKVGLETGFGSHFTLISKSFQFFLINSVNIKKSPKSCEKDKHQICIFWLNW